MSDNQWNQILDDLYSQNKYKNLSMSDNYKARDLCFNDFCISLRFHPEFNKSRLNGISNSIGNDCYFCKKMNNPTEEVVQLHDEYFALQVSYSLFLQHYFIFDFKHNRKVRTGRVFDILLFSERLKDCIVMSDGLDIPLKSNYHFYMHLINKQSLPIEKDCKNNRLLEEIYSCEDGYVGLLKNYLRGAILIKSHNKQWLANVYFEIEKLLGRSYVNDKLPYLNIMAWKNDKGWNLIIIPRVVQHPTQYYERDQRKINIASGSIEMGGVFSVSLEKDFENLSSEIIADIYSQVSYRYNHLKEIILPLEQIIKYA